MHRVLIPLFLVLGFVALAMYSQGWRLVKVTALSFSTQMEIAEYRDTAPRYPAKPVKLWRQR